MKTESQEQKTLVTKLRWLHPDVEFFAVPNGGRRNKAEARNLVLEGVEAGTPDIFIAEPREGFYGLFIELKRIKKSVVSDVQKVKHQRYLDRGYQVKICYGADDAYKTILEYLGKYEAQYFK